MTSSKRFVLVREALLERSRRHAELAQSAGTLAQERYHLAQVRGYGEVLFYMRAYEDGEDLGILVRELRRVRDAIDPDEDAKRPRDVSGALVRDQARRGRRHAYDTAIEALRHALAPPEHRDRESAGHRHTLSAKGTGGRRALSRAAPY